MHFIFEVHIKPGYSAEQYADAWLRASKIIQRSPGSQGHAAAPQNRPAGRTAGDCHLGVQGGA